MSKPFMLVLEAKIHAGKIDAVVAEATAMAADVKANEPETLDYRTFIDRANHKIWFYDVYGSSEALLNHLGRPSVTASLDKIMPLMDITALNILGDVTENAKAALDTMGATYAAPLGGFSRIDVRATVTI